MQNQLNIEKRLFILIGSFIGCFQWKRLSLKTSETHKTPEKGTPFAYFVAFLNPWSATCDSHPRPPPLSSLLITCLIVSPSNKYHCPKFQRNQVHPDGLVILAHFAYACFWTTYMALLPELPTQMLTRI